MSFSKTVRKKVYDKFGGRCAYCGKKIELKDMQLGRLQRVFKNLA